MASDKSLAAEIEAKAVKAQSGLLRAHELLAEKYSTWSPEAGTQFPDRYPAEAVEGIRLARELLAEIAAQSSPHLDTREIAPNSTRTGAAEPTPILREVLLERALDAVGWECDPADPEWSHPAEARARLYAIVTEALGRPPRDPSQEP